MKAKLIFIVALTVILTVILMKNTDPVKFWIFGDLFLSKLAVMGTLFGLGLITGLLLRRSKKGVIQDFREEELGKKGLNAEDEEYIN